MIKKLLLFLCFVYANRGLAAGDTTRVLFIGNSFTYVEDVPGLVKKLAEKAGYPFDYIMHAPGGISVGDVSQGTSAHMHNPLVYDAIRAKKWDFVVIQDNQGRFVDGGGIFPSPSASKVIEGHLKLRDSVRHYWPCARTLLFSGWAWKDGYPGLGNGEDLIRNIYENYRVLNDTMQEIIAPIGSAWLYAIGALPAIDLWSADLAHQSLEGSYLTAAVLYATIFRSSPEHVAFDGGIHPPTALQLRQLGYQAVLDSLPNSGLSNYTPELTQNGNQLVTTQSGVTYAWYKDGMLLPGNTHTMTASGDGVYQVIVTYANDCSARSMARVVQMPSGIGSVANRNDIRIFPNPVQDDLTIKTLGHKDELLTVTLSNITGSVIYAQSFKREVAVPFQHLPQGGYFIHVSGSNGRYIRKIVKN